MANLLQSLKDAIPHRWKVWYHIRKMDVTGNPVFDGKTLPPGKKVFVFLAADYGNLGDVALTLAEYDFFRRYFPDYHVVEIIIRHVVEGIQFARKHIQKDDLVSIVGGGNMGTIYPGLEMFRQIIVETFPDHKIISFPQSIHYSADETGRKALEKSKNVYGKHHHLVLVAREKISYDFMKEHFTNNKVILTPDIVFSKNESEPRWQRNGVTLSLRKDIEKKITERESALIMEVIQNHFSQITHYDTNIQKSYLSFDEKKAELRKIWDTYKRSELVVTDRLHGMIFCYITDTPCLAFLNNNHKIESSFDWIKHSNSIVLIKECTQEKIEWAVNKIKSLQGTSQYHSLDSNFQPLIEAIGGKK